MTHSQDQENLSGGGADEEIHAPSADGPEVSGEDERPLTIVGVGASAGGVQALEIFFSRVPSKSRLSFVVVQHLDPHHKSVMDSLLAKQTDLPIHFIEEGMDI